MATLREIIYDIQGIVNSFSDDSTITEEHIAFIVNNKRNFLLKQYMSNLKRPIPREALQIICLDLEQDDKCFDGLKVLKSTEVIPPTVENTGRSNIYRVYAPGSRFIKGINVIDYLRIPYVGVEKYNKKQLFTAVDPSSYLVVYSPDETHVTLESLQIEGVFENPEEAYNLSCQDDKDKCDFFDATYPIESSLIDPLKQQVVQELLTKIRVPMDNQNNGEETVVQTREG